MYTLIVPGLAGYATAPIAARVTAASQIRVNTVETGISYFLRRGGAMKTDGYPKFKNDDGVPEILIGAKEFKCIGVSPPHDHPHVYLELGDDDSILCPYCAIRFRFDATLGAEEANPLNAMFADEG